MNEQQEAQLTLWMDVIEEAINGRSNGLRCPVCEERPLEVETQGGFLKMSCGSCGAYFSGRI